MGVLDDAIREHLALKRRQGATEDEVKRQEAEALGPARREPRVQKAADDSADAASSGDEALGDDPVPVPKPVEHPPHGDPLEEDVEEVPADEVPADEVPADELLEEYGREPFGSGHEEPDAVPAETTLASDAAGGLAEDERILDEEELAEEELADELAGRDTDLAGDPELEPPQGRAPSHDASEEAPTEEQAAVFSTSVSEPDEYPEPAALEDEELLEEDEELLDEEPEPPASDPDRGADDASAEDAEDVLEDTPEFLRETPEHERLWFEQKPPRDFDLDR